MAVDVDDARLVGELGAALGTLLRLASLPRVHQRLSAAAGVTLDRSSYWLISWLVGSDGMRLSDLAELQRSDVSTVSRQVQACERDGLVERRPDASDGRASLLHLTPRGRDALQRLRRVQLAALAEMVGDWPREDQTALVRLLTQFTARFGEWADPGQRAPNAPR